MSARRRFLRDLGLFLLPLLAFWGLLETAARRLPTPLGQRKADIEGRLDRIEILVTGNSHMMMGIDPRLLGHETCTLASTGQSLYYGTALVRRYLDRLPRLRLVVLGVSYQSLESEIRDGGLRWFFLDVFGIRPHDGLRPADVLSASALLRLGPERLRILFTQKKAVLQEMPIQGEARRDEDAATRRLAESSADMRPERIPANRRYLQELVGETRRRGVELLLLTVPLSPTLVTRLDPARYRRMQETLEDLARTPGIRYRNDIADRRFGDADFRDPDHMSPRGAARYSRILVAEEIRPVFRDAPEAPARP